MNRACGKKAFTLIELLVVVAIIMLLAGLLFPAFQHAREVAKKTKAKADVKQLELAWRAVLSDFRTWAAAGSGACPLGEDAAISLLQGGNTRTTVYMDFDSSTVNGGYFVDPWFRATDPTPRRYQIARCDANGQIQPQNSIGMSRDVGAWSKGPDGSTDFGPNGDDIKSW